MFYSFFSTQYIVNIILAYAKNRETMFNYIKVILWRVWLTIIYDYFVTID